MFAVGVCLPSKSRNGFGVCIYVHFIIRPSRNQPTKTKIYIHAVHAGKMGVVLINEDIVYPYFICYLYSINVHFYLLLAQYKWCVV